MIVIRPGDLIRLAKEYQHFNIWCEDGARTFKITADDVLLVLGVPNLEFETLQVLVRSRFGTVTYKYFDVLT